MRLSGWPAVTHSYSELGFSQPGPFTWVDSQWPQMNSAAAVASVGVVRRQLLPVARTVLFRPSLAALCLPCPGCALQWRGLWEPLLIWIRA